jgi:hypothetical protein
MDLMLIHSAWGFTDAFSTGLPAFKQAGYGGVEVNWIRPSPERKADLRRALDATGLRLIPQCFTCAWDQGKTVAEHLASFRAQIEDALGWNPLMINFHSGSDAWTTAEMVEFYKGCVAIERDIPVPVVHETHRGRSFFSPWSTREVLREVPEVRFTADFSHWVCVAERIIDDQLPIIRQVAERTHHIHARVGFRGGPQIPDPRDPTYADELAAHERWWDLCWDSMAARGLARATVMPEFGPFPYTHHLPFTNMPVADLWDINRWMGRRQAERFARRG